MRLVTISRMFGYFTLIIVTFASCYHNQAAYVANSKKSTKQLTQDIKNKKISQLIAKELAERFVVDNGYTDIQVTNDVSQLSRESWDDDLPWKETLRRRQNMLERIAVGFQPPLNTGKGWLVAFRYNRNYEYLRSVMQDYDEFIEKKGRVVSMNEYGENIKIEHEDFDLKDFRKDF